VAGTRPRQRQRVPGEPLTVAVSTKNKQDYLPALTGLRFVLALWVMLHHISGKGMMVEDWANSLPAAAGSLVRGGYLAVQTFFILSGFVLARSYAKATWTRRDLWKYAVARFARIYPVYLASLALVAPFMVQAMLKPGKSAAIKAGLLLDYGLLLQGWMGNLGVGWNTPAWSLSCEFFFYLFFPFLLIGLRKANRPTVVAVLIGALITPVLMAHSSVPWQWKPVHHLSDFAAGVAASRLFEFLRPVMTRRGQWLYLPALAGGVLLVIYPGIMDGTYGDLSTGLRPLNVAALVGFALSGGALARALSTGAAQYLGKISYSMYILHVPVLWWYGYWAVYGPLHMPPGIAAVVYLLLVTALASLAFEWVEMPANRWIRDRVEDRLKDRPPVLIRAAA
jgi:peptidoglycan/LPS O-acetylase OafA/YrhL